MIITKLEFIRFGRFRNHTLELTDGFMPRRQDNETGKTTTADFIRFMFYGLPYNGRKKNMNLGDNPLEKYQPWDSEEGLCGAMEFTDERGKRWRVERTQNRKGKGEHRLLDAEGNRVEVADVGRTFLGVDAETFYNVFFIRESEAFQRTEQMELAMRNLVTGGNEEIGFDTVMNHLQEQRKKYYSATGSGGPLYQLEQTIRLRREQIAVERSRLAQREGAPEAEGNAEEQLARCEAQLEELAEAEEAAVAFEAWQRCQKRAELEARAEELTRQIEASDTPLTEEQVRRLREGFTETEGAEVLLAGAVEAAEAVKQRAPEWRERDKTVLSLESAARISGGAVALMAVGGVLSVLGLPAALLWQSLCWAVVAVGVIATVLGVVWALRLPAAAQTLGISNRAALRVELARVKELQEQVWQFQREQATAAKAVEERREHLAVLERKYAPLRAETGVTDREMLDKLLQGKSQAGVLRERLQHVDARLDELGEAQEVPPAEQPALSRAEIAARRAEVQAQKEAILARQLRLAGEAAELERDKAALTALCEELEDMSRRAETMHREYEVVALAIEEMTAAQATLRENYAPRLRTAMSEKLALFTENKYDTVMLDEELSVRLKAEGGMRELAYFSSGTVDAVMLALRLSLAEILEGERRIPMIFDDPFLHLDPTRTAVLRRYLEKAGEDRQILLLSCKEI